MPIIASEIFQRKSILSVILCNPQFYHTYITWKSSVPSQNISCSVFNRILIVFVCLSLYLSFLTNFKFLSILYNILCYPKFSHTYVRWKSLALYEYVASLTYRVSSRTARTIKKACLEKQASKQSNKQTNKQKSLFSQAVVAHACNLSTLGGRDRQISKFEANLVYSVSSRTARATQRNPVSKITKKPTKNKKQKTNPKNKMSSLPLSITFLLYLCADHCTWVFFQINLQFFQFFWIIKILSYIC